MVTHLLPAPYTTNCLDYSRIGCQSKSDCIDKCKVELNLKQCNVLPSFVNMDKSNDKHDYGQCNKTVSYSQCEIKYNSDDCFNQYYVLTFSVFEVLERQNLDKLLSKHPHLNSKSITSIDIVFHNEPDTIYHHSPQQYFVEFACYIAGVISLWTGFSVMSLYAVGQTFCHSGIKNKNLNDTPKILFKTTSKINQISIEEIRNSI